MTIETFHQFWHKWSLSWYEQATCSVGSQTFLVSSFCRLREGLEEQMLISYEKTKKKIKNAYFQNFFPESVENGEVMLNKYRRAAVLTFVICSANPLEYTLESYSKYSKDLFGKEMSQSKLSTLPDVLFLKQRLAFFIGLASILMEFNEAEVQKLPKPLFHFPALSEQEKLDQILGNGVDDFLTSVYKDLYFAESYHNRDFLALTNLFWALTASSELNSLTPLGSGDSTTQTVQLD